MTVHHVWAKTIGVAAFLAVALALFIMLYRGAGGTIRLEQPYTISTVMPDAFQLVKNADVRTAGVKIGKVAAIDSRGSQAVVKLELDDEHAPIYRDARTLLRTKTLVGENYVQLEPGHRAAGTLPDGGTLPIRQTGEAVQLDEILSSLDRPTRQSIKRNLDALGTGVDGRQRDLNRLFAAARPTLSEGSAVMAVLQRQRLRLASLVQDTGQVTRALGERDTQLQSLVRGAKQTAQAVADREAALGQTLDELPDTLDQARTSVTRLQRFSRVATPVVGNLRTGVAGLRPVLAELPRAASRTRATVAQLQPFLGQADPLLSRLAPFSRAARPAVPELDKLLREAEPFLSYLGPYHRDTGAFFANVAAIQRYRDEIGGGLRIINHIDYDSVTPLPPPVRKTIHGLQDLGGLVLDVPRMRQNPYPAPATLERRAPFSGKYTRVESRRP